jgi:hypothetical protein
LPCGLWKTIEGIVIRFGVGPAIMAIASVAVGIRGNSLRFVITQVQGITYSLPGLLINFLSWVSLSTMPLIYLQHLWLRLESLCIHVLVTSNLKQMQQQASTIYRKFLKFSHISDSSSGFLNPWSEYQAWPEKNLIQPGILIWIFWYLCGEKTPSSSKFSKSDHTCLLWRFNLGVHLGLILHNPKCEHHHHIRCSQTEGWVIWVLELSNW